MGEEYTGILTEKFVAVVGIDPRLYGTNSSVTSNPVRVVAGKWQEAAKEIFNDQKIYISAVVSGEDDRIVYDTAMGCPVGGEHVVQIRGTRNPEIDKDNWKKAVLDVVKRVKDKLDQSTVAVEFFKVELFYK
ncbi:MAG: hypothetical protein FH756_10405 [Firmicutes bacterium]|nr:hypothetical protein [Bacillota bacterium]